MELTYFQKDRGSRWRWLASIIVIAVLASLVGAHMNIGFDRAYLLYAGVIGATLYTVCLVASYSRSLLGGYRYFVWEGDRAVHVWDNGVEPTDYFAVGIPTHGILLKPVVFVPKCERHGWSLRVLSNGNLALRDREGAQHVFVSKPYSEVERDGAKKVLVLLRDAYWADWHDERNDVKGKGTIAWAMSWREHRYGDAMRDRALLADACALVAGRLAKCTAPGRFADAVKSPTGAWALSFMRRVLVWALPTDDPRRNTLVIGEGQSGSRETVRLEVGAGPDGPLPKRLPAERAEAPSGAGSPSGA